MNPNDLTLYIRDSLKKGMSREKITAQLKKAGWQDGPIAKGFRQIQSSQKPPAKKIPLPFIATAGILVVIVMVAGIYFWGRLGGQEPIEPVVQWSVYTNTQLGYTVQHPPSSYPCKVPEGEEGIDICLTGPDSYDISIGQTLYAPEGAPAPTAHECGHNYAECEDFFNELVFASVDNTQPRAVNAVSGVETEGMFSGTNIPARIFLFETPSEQGLGFILQFKRNTEIDATYEKVVSSLQLIP